ncbi:gluconate 2-dehydrogenase subunit 3 family protein, partial [Mesorhizobium sp. M2C.T.Ca.TU.009.01.2.1]
MVTVYEKKAVDERKIGLSRRELLKRGGAGALLII